MSPLSFFGKRNGKKKKHGKKQNETERNGKKRKEAEENRKKKQKENKEKTEKKRNGRNGSDTVPETPFKKSRLSCRKIAVFGWHLAGNRRKLQRPSSQSLETRIHEWGGGSRTGVFCNTWRAGFTSGLACYRGAEPPNPEMCSGGCLEKCRPKAGYSGGCLEGCLGKCLGKCSSSFS